MSMPSKQVVITSDLSAQFWSVCVWDLLTGATVSTYKIGGSLTPKSLCLLSDEYLIGALKDSSVIHVWPLKKNDSCNQKIICPGKISCVEVTPDGAFCLVAIQEKLFIWQTSSGDLLAVLERHYQAITCIRASADESYFVTGGEDGLVLVWSLADILPYSTNSLSMSKSVHGLDKKSPRHTLTYHAMKVTDIHCSQFDKFATSSLDSTCKIYSALTGKLLVSLAFDTPLWSVTMDAGQSLLMVGGQNGHVYETRLCEKLTTVNSVDPEPVYVGHSEKVTSLAVSLDGLALVSGSADNSIKVWHILAKQCMRTIQSKGPIGNLLVVPAPAGLFKNPINLMPVKSFKRSASRLGTDQSSDSFTRNGLSVRLTGVQLAEEMVSGQSSFPTLPMKETADGPSEESLKMEVQRLQGVNKAMYEFAVEKIFNKIIE